MARLKKKRSFVSQYLPADEVVSKSERLADPSSYESRKKKAVEKKKKKHKSVYQKQLEAEKAQANSNAGSGARGGRLADKIRRLNQNKNTESNTEVK